MKISMKPCTESTVWDRTMAWNDAIYFLKSNSLIKFEKKVSLGPFIESLTSCSEKPKCKMGFTVFS